MAGSNGGVQGFGSLRQQLPSPRPVDPLEAIADNTRRLADRVALPPYSKSETLSFTAAANSKVISSDNQTVNCLLVQVTTGTLYLWFGDRQGATTQPHLVFEVKAELGPVQIALSPLAYTLTLSGAGAIAEGSVTLQAL
jgi:hypothetical protein